jgi:hypothetical protein
MWLPMALFKRHSTLKAAIQATEHRAATTGRDGAPPNPLVFDCFPLPGFTETRNIGQKGP